MKIKIIIGVVVVLIAGVGAFVVAGGEPTATQEQMENMRGTEGYYAHSKEEVIPIPYGEKEIMTNLMDNKILKFSFDLKYRIGMEWGEDFGPATEAFAAAQQEIRDELLTRIRGKEAKDLKGTDLLIFKQELIDVINDIVFPKQMGRVSKLLITDLIIQG